MQVQRINFGTTGTPASSTTKFVSVGGKKNKEYENPINRGTERNLSILESIGASAIAGIIGLGLTTCVTQKRPVAIGLGFASAAGALFLTLPQKLYNAKVGAFTREKEMDVFSRQKEAQTNLYGDINDEIKDNEISLDDKIKHYSTLKMADKGNGVMIKGV